MEAVIFDKDGVLAETFDIHAKSHLKVLASMGVKATIKDVAKRYGMLTSVIIKDIKRQYPKLTSEVTFLFLRCHK